MTVDILSAHLLSLSMGRVPSATPSRNVSISSKLLIIFAYWFLLFRTSMYGCSTCFIFANCRICFRSVLVTSMCPKLYHFPMKLCYSWWQYASFLTHFPSALWFWLLEL
ncbi:Hypothetical_protein [Hexamita inflata]|uniref:Hypothetical_protein n=1 Tax=Hexamita inflata TaxID=28002 RepID=A0AA86R773_9EUKA|nr:Hypothetical protein HINF_LOCUS58347 [Hexamita inflata]